MQCGKTLKTINIHNNLKIWKPFFNVKLPATQ
ncbi:hypothetical protein EPIR_1894 [Erwinia piriflorinigrans CFBP 5888]|uniref:Uncharacterized protein n=1 Tax=Erwinia piriflorinigrans CFBP 5888 TaxID=1161919 RepID=V5Z7M6_9GAMM|nr:hypothetical protein EPIR_1894 [Erwinia piriflorinigrans CFBP 5888]